MYRPVLVTAATDTPVSLAEAKAHCRVEAAETADDAVISAMIDAAVAHLDGWTGVLGRCLMAQSWRQDFDCFERCLRLPLFPVISVTSVKYDDTAGVEQPVASPDYQLLTDGLGSYVRFDDGYAFPALAIDGPSLRVTYQAGYASAAAVPAALKHAILMLVGHWYENREAINIGNIVNALPLAVDALIAPFRRICF